MDKEERELQIKLAKLQADIQIWLTVCFGSIAILISVGLVTWQVCISIPESQVLLRTSLVGAMCMDLILLTIIEIITIKGIKAKRDEIGKL